MIGRTTTTASEVEAEHLTTNMLPPAAHPHPHPSSSSTTAKNGVSTTSSVPLTADGASTADHHERLFPEDDDDDELDLLGISGNAFVSAACAAAQVDKRLLEIQKFKSTGLYARALSLGLNEELERRSTCSSRGNKTSKSGEDVEGEGADEERGVEYRPETPIVRKEDSRKFWKYCDLFLFLLDLFEDEDDDVDVRSIYCRIRITGSLSLFLVPSCSISQSYSTSPPLARAVRCNSGVTRAFAGASSALAFNHVPAPPAQDLPQSIPPG